MFLGHLLIPSSSLRDNLSSPILGSHPVPLMLDDITPSVRSLDAAHHKYVDVWLVRPFHDATTDVIQYDATVYKAHICVVWSSDLEAAMATPWGIVQRSHSSVAHRAPTPPRNTPRHTPCSRLEGGLGPFCLPILGWPVPTTSRVRAFQGRGRLMQLFLFGELVSIDLTFVHMLLVGLEVLWAPHLSQPHLPPTPALE